MLLGDRMISALLLRGTLKGCRRALKPNERRGRTLSPMSSVLWKSSALMLRQQISTLVAAISLIASVGVGLSLSMPLLSVEMERMGVSGSGIGLNSAIAGISAILISPRVPGWAARIGVGRALALALALSAVTLLLFKVTTNYWAWFPLRFLYSVGLSALFVLSEFWIASVAPPERRGFVMGIYASLLALGFAAGPALLALVGTVGWTPYFAGVALFLTAAVPLQFASRNLPVLDAAPSHAVSGYVRAVPLAAAAGLVSGSIEIGAVALLPVQGMRIGFDVSSAALMVSAMALGNAVSQPLLGWLSDHVDRARMLVALAVSAMAVSVLLAVTATPGSQMIFPVLAVWGGLIGGFYTVGLSHLAARFSGNDLAGANAAFVVMFNAGQLAGPPFIGASLDASTRYGFAFGASVFCAFIVVVRLLEGRLATR
jgi:MFS family permease